MSKRIITSKIKFFLFVPVIFLFYTCQEEIDLTLTNDKPTMIVVEGRITDEYTRHPVKLLRTQDYFNSDTLRGASDIEVKIRQQDDNQEFTLTEIDTLQGGYYLTEPMTGRVGYTYELIVETGGQTYSAEAFLDTVAQMDSAGYFYEMMSFPGTKQGFYKIRMSAQEPEPIGHIYMFKVYMNDTLLNKYLDEFIYQNDDFFNGQYLSDVEIYWLEQERVILDTNHVVIEMYSISKDEYNYNNAILTETLASGSPFSGPPANIPSNLKNISGGDDGLGFFGASSVTRQSFILYKVHDESTNDPDYKPRP